MTHVIVTRGFPGEWGKDETWKHEPGLEVLQFGPDGNVSWVGVELSMSGRRMRLRFRPDMLRMLAASFIECVEPNAGWPTLPPDHPEALTEAAHAKMDAPPNR